MLRTTSLAFALSLVPAFATAQNAHHLVGLTRNLGNLRHQSHGSCSVLSTCAPAGFPSAAGMPWYAGGTAWDSVRRGAWISNGQFLALVDDNCNYLCAPFAVPGMGGAVVITGLEVVTSRNELWLIDSAGVLRRMTLACPPVTIGACPVAWLDPNYTTTGLAVDEARGLVFYSRVDPAGTVNVVAYANLPTPCAIVAGSTVVPCVPAAGSFTGLACDAALQRLFATDGLRTVSIDYNLVGAAVVLGAVNCCPFVATGPDTMIGLAVRPGTASSNGVACANGGCPACPMAHRLRNDPVLGNAQFGLELESAPAGALAWCAIGVGPCALPGIAAPVLCGPIYAGPALGTIGPVATAGAGCGASAGFPLALPPLLPLAGMVISSQCIVLCPAAFGTALSNCLSFQLQAL